jgi:hypothetical protein
MGELRVLRVKKSALGGMVERGRAALPLLLALLAQLSLRLALPARRE